MNKIVFCYEYNGDGSEWSTPKSLSEEFKAQGWEVKKIHLSRTNSTEFLEVINFKPEILITLDWKGLDISNLLKTTLSEQGTFLIKECGDHPQSFNRHYPNLGKFNLLLSPDYESCERLKKEGYNCEFAPHFADTRIHKHYKGLDLLPPVRSTRGPGSSFILDSLSQIMPEKFLNRNGMVGEEYGSFLNNGKITVQHSRFGEWTRRIPEGMACGTLILTDRLPKETRIEECYVDGEDIVYYDNLPDCISKIQYYLNNNEERSRIAKNGMNKTLQHHTQVQRVQQIIKAHEQHRLVG